MGVGVGMGAAVDSGVGVGTGVAVRLGMDVAKGSGVGVAVGAGGGTSVGVVVAVASPPQAAKTNISTRAMPIATYLPRCFSWFIFLISETELVFSVRYRTSPLA